MVYMYQVYYFPVARSGYSSNIIAGLLFPSDEVWIFVKYRRSFIIAQWRGLGIRQISLQVFSFLSGEVWVFVKYHCRFIIPQWRGLDIRQI